MSNAQSTPISKMNKKQLQTLMKFYDSGDCAGNLTTGRKDFNEFLRRCHYVGPRNYEHLMNPEVRDNIIRTATRLIMTDVLAEEIPLAHARVKRLKEDHDRPRTLEQIQTDITLYNPEQELETVLEEEDVNVESVNVDVSNGYFPISPPSNPEAFETCLEEIRVKYDKGISSQDTDSGEPAPVYYFNQIETLDEFHDLINHVLNVESGLIKITYGFVMISEQRISEDSYEYVITSSKENKKFSVPISINLLERKPEIITNLHEYLNTQINKSLEVGLANTSSSTRRIGITNFAIYVSRTSAVGGKQFPIPEKVANSKNIITYKSDDNLCLWFIIGVLENPIELHGFNDKHKIILARKTFKQYNPDKEPDTFEGSDMENILTQFAARLDKHFYIYTYDEPKDQYKILYDIGANEKPETQVNLLLLSTSAERQTEERPVGQSKHELVIDANALSRNSLINPAGAFKTHILLIKDHEKLFDCKICPKCRLFCSRKGDKNGVEFVFAKHVRQCDGKLKQDVKLPSIALPYLPHVYNNSRYIESLAHGTGYEPIRTYITYDFETVLEPKNKSFGSGSTWISALHPMTVAWTVKSPMKSKTYSLYRADLPIFDFVQKWLRLMLESLDDDDFEVIGVDSKQKQQINVIGYNSARFDTHLILNHLVSDDWSIKTLLGNVKMLILENVNQKQFRFIDLIGFYQVEH
jgi:hypothetical protein